MPERGLPPGAVVIEPDRDRDRLASGRRSPWKSGSWRYETSWKDYGRALDDAKRVAAAGGLHLRRRMAVGGDIFDLMPMSHLRPGMEIVVESDGQFIVATVEQT